MTQDRRTDRTPRHGLAHRATVAGVGGEASAAPFPDREFPPGPAELADLAALVSRNGTDATAPHEQIAQELWTALHRLGVRGRMLVVGEDPEVYAGLPRAERRITPGATAEFFGYVPAPSWPHAGLSLHRSTGAEAMFDLVINNIPENDVVTHSTTGAVHHWHREGVYALGSVALTAPGGLTVLVASNRLLDDAEPYVRRELSRLAELIGALRLPSGTLRQARGNDGPVDLILLHRTESPDPTGFTASIPVTLDGAAVHINEYYAAHPDHVLGTLTSRDNPWGPGPASTTVLPRHLDLTTELRSGLNTITRSTTHMPHARQATMAAGVPGLGSPGAGAGGAVGGRAASTAAPGQELGTARAVVARLRAQNDSTGPARPDPARRGSPEREPGPPGP